MRHHYAVRSRDSRNGIAMHASTNQNNVDWDAAKVVAYEVHLISRVPAYQRTDKHKQPGQWLYS